MGAFSDVLRLLKLKPPKRRHGKGQYWQRRSDLHYYKVVREWINEQEAGERIIDVGSQSTPLVLEGNFNRRTMVDIRRFTEKIPGVEQIVSDWMKFKLPEQVDLVLCLQVLEHLPDEVVSPFAQKLLSAGKRVIISVPHQWPKGQCRYHLQDPVDLAKLVSWTRKEPVRHYIEKRDSKERLIALFEN